jgi:hypothetical protein
MSALSVRVRVQDAWEEVPLTLDAATPLATLKREALTRARRPGDPDRYQLKFRGAAILDEARSLADAGVVANAELIVLPRRRQPVR